MGICVRIVVYHGPASLFAYLKITRYLSRLLHVAQLLYIQNQDTTDNRVLQTARHKTAMTNLTRYLLLSFSCLLWIQCTAAFKADPIGVVYEAAPLAKREVSQTWVPMYLISGLIF